MAFGYALLHGVQMLRETFEWPLLVPRLTVFILLVGVPLAVTLAWYHGHRAQHRVSGGELSILIALLLVAGSVLWWASRVGSARGTPSVIADATHLNAPLGDKSIAVLPFLDLSEKHDQEYFADGMAEEIIDLLAKIPSLTVIGRTSSFQFKGKSEDLRTIGTTLGATYVLEGSVRKAADRIRVTAQLVNTKDGTHSWSDTFDRDFGDVLSLQDEVAAGVARALQVTVDADIAQPRRKLMNPTAYTLYLRGLYALDRHDEEGFQEAQTNFEQALALDPAYLQAAEMLTTALAGQVAEELVPSEIGWEKVRNAADRALRIDANSAQVHATLGLGYAFYEFDFTTADTQVAQSLKRAPRDPLVLDVAARSALIHGHLDEALRHVNAALTFDPLSPLNLQLLGEIHYLAGRLPAAEAAVRKAIQISPTANENHFLLGQVLLARGLPEAALKEMQMESPDGGRDAGLAVVYYALGRHAESDRALARLTQQHGSDWAYGIAETHAFRGERDDAFVWLDRAYSMRNSDLQFVKADPLLNSLRSDSRYKLFLRKMNLPQ